ncbi:MAG TPA: TSUP family transporter [Verrucomicrobiae bacterium]|nr:TSUP family transporter [Verrucomicrobiae bacterium]
MIEWWQIGPLFITGLVAGFVDTLAGGGGLLTLPVLLTICPDPKIALGTNKLQASFGSTSAALHFARAGALNLRDCILACALTFLGSLAGSVCVQQFNSHLLKEFVPFLLLAVAVFVWLRPQLGAEDIHPRISRIKFDFVFALGIGFYDGLFGPGTGTFLALAYMLGLGFNLAKATAHAKALNCASNIAALIVFLVAKKVWFVAGIAMGCGQWLGARLGSRMVIKRGTKFIRPVFLTMVVLVTLKMIWDMWLRPTIKLD